MFGYVWSLAIKKVHHTDLLCVAYEQKTKNARLEHKNGHIQWKKIGQNSFKKWPFSRFLVIYGQVMSFYSFFLLKMIWWKFREYRTLGSVKTKLPSLNLISWNVKVWRRKWSTVPRRFRAEISTWERILEIILKYIWNTIINDQLYFVNTRYKFDRLYQTHRLRSKIAGVTLGENDSKIFE